MRVVGHTWEEKVSMYGGIITVVHSETVCPDKDCQKLVEEKLKEVKDKKDTIKKNKEERMALMNKNRGKAAALKAAAGKV
jgi:hypothetical protein